MITKKLLEDKWIPTLMGAFFNFMPKIKADCPLVYIAKKRTLKETIKEIEERTQSLIQIKDDPDVIFIYGQSNDALLVILDNLPSLDEEIEFLPFAHSFWYELGRFYAIYTEPEDWEYVFTKDYENPVQRAYRLWSVFIAETISNYIIEKVIDKLISENKILVPKGKLAHAELSVILNEAVSASEVNEKALGLYFGILLTGDFCDKKDAISTVSNQQQVMLNEIKKLLETQLKKKEFWKIPNTRLSKLGGFINALELFCEESPLQRAMKQREEMLQHLIEGYKNNNNNKSYKPRGRKK